MNHISSLTLGVRVNTQQCLRETTGVFVVDSNNSRAGEGYKMNVQSVSILLNLWSKRFKKNETVTQTDGSKNHTVCDPVILTLTTIGGDY